MKSLSGAVANVRGWVVMGSLFACLAVVPAYADTAREVQGLPSLAPLVDSVKAAVVNVEVAAAVTPEMGDGEEGVPDFFGPFFRMQPQRQQIRQGQGSGFVIDPKGIILTNNHVVQGATSIRVKFNDGRSFQGEVLGRDPATDVAVIRIKGAVGGLPSVKLGDSDAMRVGDWVVAIGNPFGLASSVSAGIISARARELRATEYDDFLQTDAAINPGNSGGPLFNLKGEVIGINTAIVGGASSIGFAVPSNIAKALLPQLEKGGKIVRGYMGVNPQKVTPEIAKLMGIPVSEGVLVVSTEKDSPAQRAGLKRDDVIVAVDGAKVDSEMTLKRVVALKAPGSTVQVAIYRDGHAQQVKMTLGTRPQELARGGREEGSGSDVNPDEEAEQRPVHLTTGLHLFDNGDPRLIQILGGPPDGAVIHQVDPGSAASQAGLTEGMLVFEANRHPIHNSSELARVIRTTKPGASILLRVRRAEADRFTGRPGTTWVDLGVRVLVKPS